MKSPSGSKKTNPNKANLRFFAAENAEYAEKKDICVSGCLIEKYTLYPISPRSLRTRRLMKNKANFKRDRAKKVLLQKSWLINT